MPNHSRRRLFFSRKFHLRFVLMLTISTAGTILFFSSTLMPKDNGSGAEMAHSVTASTYERSRENGLGIFFIETSGRLCLTARQACAVESAARANPNATITLYLEKTAMLTTESTVGGRRADCVITNALFQQMRNTKISREELLDNLKDTPLWKLKETASFNGSKSPLVHRSDAVRVAVLWKKGGIYLDLDVVVFRQLDALNNTVGKVKDFVDNWVENGVMAFEAGHPFLKYLMKTMVVSFRPELYLSLGPATLYDALTLFCDRDDFPASRWLTCRRNSSLMVQPPDAFYAISNAHRERFYQPEADPADWYGLRDSFLSHIYDSKSMLTIPVGSLYAKLAGKYCPISYGMATKDGNYF